MALNSRKYATLADIDSSPDIYETPELTDDSTLPTGTVRSHSSASSYKDFEDDEDENLPISRSRLHPNEARSHFSPARVDARDVDFSDRVNGKRKSYKTSSRRQEKCSDGTEVIGDLSDEEDGESLERKLARLRREIEEVREEVASRESDKHDASDKPLDGLPNERDVAALSKLLDTISTIHRSTGERVGKRLARSGQPPQTTTTSTKGSETATSTVSNKPDFTQTPALASAAQFDSRLILLEKALGITGTPIPVLDSNGLPIAVIPTLDKLQRQVSVLAEATPSSLDTISRRVRVLTQEAEKLEEARKAAKQAQIELIETNANLVGGSIKSKEGDTLDQVTKINALFGTLATIENLAPLLPPILDRLRSLRAIHADAAVAGENLDRVAKRQEEMAVDIKKWREGLERVEQAMNKGEGVMGENMKIVEGWVKDLEERMSRL